MVELLMMVGIGIARVSSTTMIIGTGNTISGIIVVVHCGHGSRVRCTVSHKWGGLLSMKCNDIVVRRILPKVG